MIQSSKDRSFLTRTLICETPMARITRLLPTTRIILIAFAVFAATSCQKANDKNPALLGKWQGVEWLIFDKPSGMDASKVEFEFKADGSYEAEFADQKQAGTWRTEKDKLYTQETGKQEIMVKLLKIDASSLDFEMNRGGQKETLKLAKK